MTTTAEKIKELQADLNFFQESLEELKAEINPPQPADPEPLECWVNVYNAGFPIHAFESPAEALRSAGDANSAYRGRIAVRMLEVTPQDEQDRKDAARYRRAKKWLRNSNYLHDIALGKWDEMIDKAIKDQ